MQRHCNVYLILRNLKWAAAFSIRLSFGTMMSKNGESVKLVLLEAR